MVETQNHAKSRTRREVYAWLCGYRHSSGETVMTTGMEEELRNRLSERRVIIVAGTGVSLSATGNLPLASWSGLVRDGVAECIRLELAGSDAAWGDLQYCLLDRRDLNDTLGVAEQIARRLGYPRSADWRAWLRRTVGSLTAKYPQIVKQLADFNVPLATLNYDDILSVYLNRPVVTWLDSASWPLVLEGRDNAIIHLHGHWRSPESVVFGIQSYERIYNSSLTQHLLRMIVTGHSLMFVGCGATFADPNFSELLRWMAKTLSETEIRHYILVSRDGVQAVSAMLPGSCRIAVVEYGDSTDKLVPFLEGLRQGNPPAAFGHPKTTSLATTIDNNTQNKNDLFITRNRNWLPECLELILDTVQGSNITEILLNAEVRAGQQRFRHGQTVLFLGTTSARLVLMLSGCVVKPGPGIGDEEVSENVSGRPDVKRRTQTIWQIARPKDQPALTGYLLGHENLCNIVIPQPGVYKITAVLEVYIQDLVVNLGPKFSEVSNSTRNKILKIVIGKGMEK